MAAETIPGSKTATHPNCKKINEGSLKSSVQEIKLIFFLINQVGTYCTKFCGFCSKLHPQVWFQTQNFRFLQRNIHYLKAKNDFDF